MKAFKEIEGTEVLSSDGKMMGKVEDFTYGNDHKLRDVVVKMNKDIVEELGEDKPLLASVKLKIDLEHIKAFTDNVVLNKALDELHIYFHEVTDDDLLTSIIGKELSGSEGEDVGKVDDMIIDTDSWDLPSMLVKLEKDVLETLDIKKSLLSKTRLGISMSHVTSIGDKVMLDSSAKEMGKILEDEPIKKM